MAAVTFDGYGVNKILNKNLDLKFCGDGDRVRGIRGARVPSQRAGGSPEGTQDRGQVLRGRRSPPKERDNSRTARDLSGNLLPAIPAPREPKLLYISLLDKEENDEESWIKNHIGHTAHARRPYNRGSRRTRAK